MKATAKYTLLIQLLVVGITIMAIQGYAIAQSKPACASIATPDPPLWSDSNGDTVNLAQDADGTVTGDQTGDEINSCFDNFYVISGTSEGNRKFTLQFRDDNNPPTIQCNQTLTYNITISGPGCARGSGTIAGYPLGPAQNPVTWSDGDGVQATNEIEYFLNWVTDQPALALFGIDINPTSYNFTGRQVTESFPDGGVDGCWFPGSKIPEWNPSGVTQYVTLDPNRSNGIISGYGDDVGFGDAGTVDHYRGAGRAPCAMTTTQVVSIDTYSGSEQYEQNEMSLGIGANTVTMQRGALVESRPLVSLDVAAVPAAIFALTSLLQN